jgi:hypothetical protein
MILALMGTEMFVLAGSSNKIAFQTNQTLLEVVQQNLISSGLTWAEYNIENKTIREVKEKIQLNTAEIGTREAQLGVTTEKIQNKQAQVIINTSCSRGRESLKHNKKYQIALRRR